MQRGPRYARLNHEFDRDLLLDEVNRIPIEHFETIAATRWDKSSMPYKFDLGDPFEIADPEVLDQSTYTTWAGDQKELHRGPISTYTHCCFTHPPGRSEMRRMDNILVSIEGKPQRYVRPYIVFRDPWEWTTAVDHDLSRIRAELERLPFEFILRARAIVLWDGDHLGNVHRDSVPFFTDPWMNAGFGVINLNLLDGGSTLNIKIDGVVIPTNDPCFTFDETLYHGSTRSDQRRVQINVVGKFDLTKLESLLDKDSIVW